MKRVYLEICNACNLSCSFCAVPKGNEFMSLQEIDSYTDQILPVCSYLYLHILGEPLLHPDFEKILDMLDEKGFRLQLVSNGTLLDRYPDLLRHESLRKLSISVHSADDKTSDSYFSYIDHLIEHNEDKTIELRFYDPEHLSERVRTYRDSLLKRYEPSFSKKQDSLKLKENVYLYTQKLFRWPDINDPILSDNGTCHGGIDQIAINVHGDVTLCCLDPKAYNKLGNLKKDSLEAILSSERYQEIINGFRNRKVLCDLCKRCSYKERF